MLPKFNKGGGGGIVEQGIISAKQHVSYYLKGLCLHFSCNYSSNLNFYNKKEYAAVNNPFQILPFF
jgi:hypothetical protein